MTPEQIETFKRIINNTNIETFHHGDCKGADHEAHILIRALKPKVKIVVHPPNNRMLRAFCNGDIIRPENDYLTRDYNIVKASKKIIATPKQEEEIRRSGTWTTIRYSRKLKREISIIYPDGTISKK